MNNAFNRGFIKRAVEHGLTEKQANGLFDNLSQGVMDELPVAGVTIPAGALISRLLEHDPKKKNKETIRGGITGAAIPLSMGLIGGTENYLSGK